MENKMSRPTWITFIFFLSTPFLVSTSTSQSPVQINTTTTVSTIQASVVSSDNTTINTTQSSDVITTIDVTDVHSPNVTYDVTTTGIVATTSQANVSTDVTADQLNTTLETTNAADENTTTLFTGKTTMVTPIQSNISTSSSPSLSTSTLSLTSSTSSSSSSSTTTTTKITTTDKQTTGSEARTKSITTTPLQDDVTDFKSTASQGKTTTGDKSSTYEGHCEEKAFGKTGFIAFIVVCVICVLLLLILLILILLVTKRRRKLKLQDDGAPQPKLTMLEIRDAGLKSPSAVKPAVSPTDDGLQTYSLDYDYEKHVQDSIEEHKRKNIPKEEKVSTFMLGKKASLLSTNSNSSKNSSNPNSPVLATELTPLSTHEDGDVNVFNFTQKPGESLAARRMSSFESGNRKKSSSSQDKGSNIMMRKGNSYVDNVVHL